MAKLPVLLTRLDDEMPDVGDVSARLRRHLMRLRGHEIGKPDLEAFHIAMDAITDDEVARLRERARAHPTGRSARPRGNTTKDATSGANGSRSCSDG